MRTAVVVLSVLACTPKSEWKERRGPEFVVSGRRDAVMSKRPIVEGTEMSVYEYADGVVESMQVDVVDLPAGQELLRAITSMRDHYAKDATITAETTVTMGDALGADLRFTKTYPSAGLMGSRVRIVGQNGKLFVVVALWPANEPQLAKNGDRFVESFRFTTPATLATSVLADAGLTGNLGSADGTGWYTFHSTRQKLTVSTPGAMTEAETELPDHEGRMYLLGTFVLPARIKFMTTCITDGSRVVTRDDFVAKLVGITQRRDRVVQGREAVELESASESLLAVFEPKRLCMLVVEPYSKTAPAPPEAVRRFFDSLVFD